MKVVNKSDFPLTDAACNKETGMTLKQWFKELDEIDALAKGRRATIQHVYGKHADAWWSTTIAVEYEAHHDVKKKDGRREGYTICVTKSIGAPVEAVYKVWTDPGKFSKFFGDGGKQSLKVDGSLACKSGCQGTFTRIRPDKDLRFTWEHKGCTTPMQVDVQFQNNKGKCLMNVMTSRIQTRAEADGLRNAWSEALTTLKSLCES